MTTLDCEVETNVATNKKTMDRYACIITAGELDPNWYGHYLKNDLRRVEVVKNNVTKEEVDEWLGSQECMKRVHELEQIGKDKFGKDYWMKYSVNYFFTSALKDDEMQKMMS